MKPVALRLFQSLAILILAALPVPSRGGPQVALEGGIRLVSKVEDGHLAVYEGERWRPRFWTGVNLGATTPGHFPGELSPTKEDYRRWFRQMKDMNARLVRIYTIFPPQFYEALLEFNANQDEPLWLLQEIWPPEEVLSGYEGEGNDAFAAAAAFRAEIADAVRAVHGDLVRPPQPGRASGAYHADVSQFLLGWLVGAEWSQSVVKATDERHAGMQAFLGNYFHATAGASPFENWLAEMLEQVAIEEMRYGWQHPAAFVNWPTTDPLRHASEPDPQEDWVSVDPGHVAAAPAWRAGYYAAYHVYPYYPDFMRFDPQYLAYRDAAGNRNPYAGYLHDLKAHHSGIPVIIAEFGVPSSRGLAHSGPLGRDQGMHTEEEQGRIDAELLASIYGEGYDGGILFSWLDEWYKTTWNIVGLELPGESRPRWLNPLANEQFFGVMAAEPGPAGSRIKVDGNAVDWDRARSRADQAYPAMDLSVSHDEAYLYLLLRKRAGTWDFRHDAVHVGFQILPGGSRTADLAPGIVFSRPIQFLLEIKGPADARLSVLSAYDQHTFRWGVVEQAVEFDARYADPSQGLFLPWKLLLSRPLVLPLTGQRIPAEEADIGAWRMGISDPDSPAYDSLADWYAAGDILEVRIPWMMLGFTDPSGPFVWNWPHRAGRLEAVPAPGVWMEVHLSGDGADIPSAGGALLYSWRSWQLPEYHERPKASYAILRGSFSGYDLPIAAAEASQVPVISSISPPSVAAGGGAASVSVTGWNFLPNSVIRWNGTDRNTDFVSSSELRVSIFAEDIAIAGTAQITASNPPPGGGASRAVPFPILDGPASPVLTSAGLVNGASFRGVFPAAGSIASLFGSNLASSPAFADTLPLPAALNGVTVRLNDISAPLLYVSPGQINFQIPWELSGQAEASLTVTTAGGTSRPITIYPAAFAPGIFSVDSRGTGQGVVLTANTWELAAPSGSIPGSAARPAARGEIITIFCTGLGDVTNRPPSGREASADPLSETTAVAAATVGGMPASVSFAGLAPSFVGLYQVNIRIPESAPAGDAVPLALTIGGVSSNAVTIAVE